MRTEALSPEPQTLVLVLRPALRPNQPGSLSQRSRRLQYPLIKEDTLDHIRDTTLN